MRPARRGGAEVWDRWAEEIDPDDGFDQPEVRSYERAETYSTAHYVELLQTHSDHIVLDAEQRKALLRGVTAVIDTAGGQLELGYVTHLCLARAV